VNGVHDLGGMDGFGHVNPESNEPVFHHPWEATVFGISLTAMGQEANLDRFRHLIERMDPVRYLSSTYYEHWLAAIETAYIEGGVLTAGNLDHRANEIACDPERKLSRRDEPARTEGILRAIRVGNSSKRRVKTRPLFKTGDTVVTRNLNPRGHTRLPRYARGKRGVIDRVHGAFAFPDSNAHGLGEKPEHVYSVRFAGHELWGEAAEPNQCVNLDLWQSYLMSTSRRAAKKPKLRVTAKLGKTDAHERRPRPS